MTTYILRRLITLVPVLVGVSMVVFLLITLIPGDPASVLLGPTATVDQIQRLRESLALDQPLHVQYLAWLGRALQGDLGSSSQYGVPVTQLIPGAFANTAILSLAAMAIASAVGIPIGVAAATNVGSLFDRASMVILLFVNSLPGFWLGLMLILLFSVNLGWLPTGGMGSLRSDEGTVDLLRHLVLPAITLSSFSIATISLTARASLLEVLSQDYMRTAISKGLTDRAVIYTHGLRNAMLPIVTVLGLQAGYLLGGAVLTETVFSWPGLGLLLFQSIGSRDISVIQGGMLTGAAVFVAVNLVVDLLYASLDPRIRYS